MLKFLIESSVPQLEDHIEEFCQFVYDKLGIMDAPSLTFVERTGQASFGNYSPSTGAIVVATEGRHMCDIFRTVAHEIVHARQMEDGIIDSTPLLELEHEANAVAGLLLRDANKEHPEWYGVEEPLPDDQLDQEGESLGAVDSDTTRPSGPINMAESKIKETDTDALKLLKLQNQALRAFASSPRQHAIQKEIEVLRNKMKKEGSSEYHTTLKEDKGGGLPSLRTEPRYPIGQKGRMKYTRLTLDLRKKRFHGRGARRPTAFGMTQAEKEALARRPAGSRRLAEDMTAGAGDIAGIGIGPHGEPGVPQKKTLKVLRRKLVEYQDKARTINDADTKKRAAQTKAIFGQVTQ